MRKPEKVAKPRKDEVNLSRMDSELAYSYAGLVQMNCGSDLDRENK